MIYSTLKEVYNVDSFDKEKKSKPKKKKYEYEEEVDEEPKSVITQSSQTQTTSSPLAALSPSVPSVAPEVPKPSMSSVQPYYDEELEQYLYEPQTKSQQVTRQQPQDRQQIQPLQPLQIRQPAPTVPSIYDYTHTAHNAKDTYYKNLVNIGLFIFIGILIIFLCDQITEIAINLGMKKTVQLLEPYLSKDMSHL